MQMNMFKLYNHPWKKDPEGLINYHGGESRRVINDLPQGICSEVKKKGGCRYLVNCRGQVRSKPADKSIINKAVIYMNVTENS